jgi:chromosome segregation ATPase
MGWKQDRHHLIQMDRENAELGRRIEDYKNKIAVLNQKLSIKRSEYARINRKHSDLTNTKNTLYGNKTSLENYKSQLETHQRKLKYSIQILEKELDDLKQFVNIQQRNNLHYDKEYNQLFNKVVLRNQLKHSGYTLRNAVLNRASTRMEQKYSNIHSDSKYQQLHNEYFMTINSIFWWIYYLLFIVLCYQIVYIQTDLTLITKITWLSVSLLFPLLYYVYDLVVIKI